MLLEIPAVQQRISTNVANYLSTILRTEISVGHIDLDFINRIIINDLEIKDQQQQNLLTVKRASAKINLKWLLQGKIVISTAQLFDFDLSLYQNAPTDKPNFQFIVDELFSGESKEDNQTDLRINTLLIRRGKVSYNKNFVEQTPEKLNTNHIDISGLHANISIKTFSKDSINAKVKKFAAYESSGLAITSLDFHILANNKQANLCNFRLSLPNSIIELDTIKANYNLTDSSITNFVADIAIKPSHLTLFDLSSLIPEFNQFQSPILFSAQCHLNEEQIDLSNLFVHTKKNELSLAAEATMSATTRPLHYNLLQGRIEKLNISERGYTLLRENLPKENTALIEQIANLGNTNCTAEITLDNKEIKVNGNILTSIGTADFIMQKNNEGEYNAHLNLSKFEPNKFLPQYPQVEQLSLTLQANGVLSDKIKDVDVKGLISEVQLNNYSYTNIKLDGIYNQNNIKGSLSVNDPNAIINLNRDITLANSEAANVLIGAIASSP